MGVLVEKKDDEKRADRQAQTCLFLGLAEDYSTAVLFPSAANCCFHAIPVETVKLEFQEANCLTQNHKYCRVYTRRLDGPLPPEMRFKKERVRGKISSKTRVWVPFIAFAVVILIVWLALSRGPLGSVNLTPSPVMIGSAVSAEVGLKSSPITTRQNKETSIPKRKMTALPTISTQSKDSPVSSSRVADTTTAIIGIILVILGLLLGVLVISAGWIKARRKSKPRKLRW